LSTSTVISGLSALLTGLPGNAARHAGPDIRIQGGRITAIGSLAPQTGEARVDASGCIAYPAWVNTHHHLAEALMKGMPAGIDANLSDWVQAVPIAHRGRFDERLMRTAARIGLVELALSGCGTVADHNFVYFPDAGFDSGAILFEEAERLGLRLVLCRAGATLERHGAHDPHDRWRPEIFEAWMRSVEATVRAFHDPAPDAMRRVVMAPTTPFFDIEPAQFAEAAQVGRGLGIRLHTHLSETVAYASVARERFGCLPVEYCARHGWLGEDVWFAHLVKLTGEEIRELGRTRTGMAHCPQSNARLGSGIAPATELEAAGARVSLGVDGSGSNEAADMISEVHAAWLLQRARAGESARPAHEGGRVEGGAGAARVEDVVRWGTAGGADVLGFPDGGRIAVGALADIAVYDLDAPRYLGLHDRALGPVISGGRPRLKGLWVAGHRIVTDDALPGFDHAQLAAEAREAVTRLNRART
jgi:cytosine/adenosine deaminase-related metal-dependent hydrolase